MNAADTMRTPLIPNVFQTHANAESKNHPVTNIGVPYAVCEYGSLVKTLPNSLMSSPFFRCQKKSGSVTFIQPIDAIMMIQAIIASNSSNRLIRISAILSSCRCSIVIWIKIDDWVALCKAFGSTSNFFEKHLACHGSRNSAIIAAVPGALAIN